MISEEMIKAFLREHQWSLAAHAHKEFLEFAGMQPREFGTIGTIQQSHYLKHARSIVELAYPLIRAQVLEEAAGVCEDKEKIAPRIMAMRGYNMALKDCAQAIRDLKTKGE